jgi:hypothetical protein
MPPAEPATRAARRVRSGGYTQSGLETYRMATQLPDPEPVRKLTAGK